MHNTHRERLEYKESFRKIKNSMSRRTKNVVLISFSSLITK